jgi:hypothetical protein
LGAAASLSKDLNQHIERVVDDLGVLGEIGNRIDDARDSKHAIDSIEAADLFADIGAQARCGGSRSLVALLGGHSAAYLAELALPPPMSLLNWFASVAQHYEFDLPRFGGMYL